MRVSVLAKFISGCDVCGSHEGKRRLTNVKYTCRVCDRNSGLFDEGV